MTDEQIKQNAEEYTKEVYDNKFEQAEGFWGGTYHSEDITDAFIEGAHSRDGEIKQWKESKRKLRLRLMQRIRELRNPWISVEDRLPEENEPVLLWLGGCYKVALLRDCRWWECTGFRIGRGWSALDALSIREVECITHWMPIPELPNNN